MSNNTVRYSHIHPHLPANHDRSQVEVEITDSLHYKAFARTNFPEPAAAAGVGAGQSRNHAAGDLRQHMGGLRLDTV